MTYGELLSELNKLTVEQLDQDAMFFNDDTNEYLPVEKIIEFRDNDPFFPPLSNGSKLLSS